jgi:trimethylamine--corrinoid protein Co-methyltransferase
MTRIFPRQFSREIEQKIINEAFALLEDSGIRVQNRTVLDLLASAGATVDLSNWVAKIPEKTSREAIQNCPGEFALYNQQGEPVIQFGGPDIYFTPGSSALTVLDRDSQQI